MEVAEPTNFQLINAKCSCFNLRRATRAVTQYYDHCLEPAGIRVTQFTLLVSMAAASTQTLTEMAGNLVMDRTTLTRNLKPLEKLGLIQSIRARDRRSKAYALTDKGREALKAGIPLWQSAQKRVIASLGEDRFQFILKELDALTKMMHFN